MTSGKSTGSIDAHEWTKLRIQVVTLGPAKLPHVAVQDHVALQGSGVPHVALQDQLPVLGMGLRLELAWRP